MSKTDKIKERSDELQKVARGKTISRTDLKKRLDKIQKDLEKNRERFKDLSKKMQGMKEEAQKYHDSMNEDQDRILNIMRHLQTMFLTGATEVKEKGDEFIYLQNGREVTIPQVLDLFSSASKARRYDNE